MKMKNVFKVSAPEKSTGYLFWKTSTAWQRRVKAALLPYDIPIAQFVVMTSLLWLMTHQQMTNQSCIVELSGLDKMTVSKTLKKMVLGKLVKKTEDKSDTRAKQVELTAKGIKLTEDIINITRKVDQDFFNKLSSEEEATLKSLMQRL